MNGASNGIKQDTGKLVVTPNEKGNITAGTNKNGSIQISRKTNTIGATVTKMNGSIQTGAKVIGRMVGIIVGTSHMPTTITAKTSRPMHDLRETLPIFGSH